MNALRYGFARGLAGAAALLCALGSWVSCGSGTDDSPGVPLDPSAITWDSLAAAREKILAGSDEEALNADGSVVYRHIRDEATASDTEELISGGAVVLRWTHESALSHVEQDTDGDGAIDWQVDATGDPQTMNQVIVVSSGFSKGGEPTRRETTAQTSESLVQVTIEVFDAGAWVVVDAYETTILQSELGLSTSGCTGAEESTIKIDAKRAVNVGLECLRQLKVDDIRAELVVILSKRGLHFNCGQAPSGSCAQASIFDTFTSGAFNINGKEVVINLSTDGAAGCANRPKTIFHELLHIVTGKAHSLFLDTSTPAGRSKDRIYSCADVCFEQAIATQCECATCLMTDKHDPRCVTYQACASFHVVMTTSVAASPLPCAYSASDIADKIEFTLTPAAGNTFTVDNIQNTKTTYGPLTKYPAGTLQIDTDPEFFDGNEGTGNQEDFGVVTATLKGTTTQGGCTVTLFDGSKVPTPGMKSPAELLLFFDPTKFVNGSQVVMNPGGWSATITE